MKNNGITIICDNFEIDGKEVKLRNFSIVNGGQTTYMLHKSKHINEDHDLFLPCKIITVVGDSEDEKNLFSLEIAKATNSQKAIKPVDLKANSPEQVRFGQAMREVGLFYQTKRGENVPSGFKDDYKNSDLVEIGKLCLAAVFQIPCASRAKPSLLYYPQYYEPVFNGNQGQISKLCKELLYIDFYFRTAFQKKFDRENENEPDSNVRISFAHNARTICVAFVAFAARYYQDNITREDLQVIFNYARSEGLQDSSLYDIFKNLDGVASFLPQGLFNQKDKYDEVLYQLFTTIINAGITNFVMATYADNTLNATNFLKKDKNYYRILQTQWTTISTSIKAIFSNIT